MGAHLRRIFPVVRRTGFILGRGTNVGPILNARDIRSIRPYENAAGALLRVQLYGRPGLKHQVQHLLVFFRRSIAEINVVGFADARDFFNPLEKLFVLYLAGIPHCGLINFDCCHYSLSLQEK
jgi:hypothetical protein